MEEPSSVQRKKPGKWQLLYLFTTSSACSGLLEMRDLTWSFGSEKFPWGRISSSRVLYFMERNPSHTGYISANSGRPTDPHFVPHKVSVREWCNGYHCFTNDFDMNIQSSSTEDVYFFVTAHFRKHTKHNAFHRLYRKIKAWTKS